MADLEQLFDGSFGRRSVGRETNWENKAALDQDNTEKTFNHGTQATIFASQEKNKTRTGEDYTFVIL